MIDKALLRVLGTNKKYIYYAVLLMILGLLANLAVTASLCYAIRLLIGGARTRAIFPADRSRDWLSR